jgi:hypothetical protein
VLNERVGSANILEPSKADLCNDGTELAAGGRDTVCCGAVAGGEGFTGDDL